MSFPSQGFWPGKYGYHAGNLSKANFHRNSKHRYLRTSATIQHLLNIDMAIVYISRLEEKVALMVAFRPAQQPLPRAGGVTGKARNK
jgi:hypothetical protein